jgi:hypothetical protein
MIITSYLHVGVRYRNNNRIACELAPISIVTLWIKVDVVNRCWKQWWNTAQGPCSTTVHHIHLHQQCNDTNWSYFTRYSIILPVMHTDV